MPLAFCAAGKAAHAVHNITSGLSAWQSTGARVWIPFYLSLVTEAYAAIGQFDDAWRCIGEATTAIQTTKEKWCEAEVHRVAGEIALMSPEPDATKAQAYFERALAVARQQQAKSLGELRAHEPRAALARPGQGAGSHANCRFRFTGGSLKGSARAIWKEAKALLEQLSS